MADYRMHLRRGLGTVAGVGLVIGSALWLMLCFWAAIAFAFNREAAGVWASLIVGVLPWLGLLFVVVRRGTYWMPFRRLHRIGRGAARLVRHSN